MRTQARHHILIKIPVLAESGPSLVLVAIYFTYRAAYRLPTLRRPRNLEYSYGLYLYGFAVQQGMAALSANTPL